MYAAGALHQARPFTSKPEHKVVYEIGYVMQQLLIKLGYKNTIISRGAIGGPILRNRIAAANKLSAHYYISLHSDGDTQYRYTFEECFGIYYPDPDASSRQKDFAADMMKYYTHSANNKGVSISRNKSGQVASDAYGITDPAQSRSIRRTILELGVTTNPKWYDQALAQKRAIAKELVLGLEENINKYYFIRGKELEYEFNGKRYKTREEIPYSNRPVPNPNYQDTTNKPLPWDLVLSTPANNTYSTLPPPEWDEAKKTKTIFEKLPLPKVDIDKALAEIPIN